MSARLFSEQISMEEDEQQQQHGDSIVPDSQETTDSFVVPPPTRSDAGDKEGNHEGARPSKNPRLGDTEVAALFTQEGGERKEEEGDGSKSKPPSPGEATTEEEAEREMVAEEVEVGEGYEEEEEKTPSFISRIRMDPLYSKITRDDMFAYREGIPSLARIPKIPRDEPDLKEENLADRLVVILLDASRSMVTKDVVAAVVELLRQIARLGSKATVAVVAYNCQAHLLLPPRQADSVSDEDILAVLRGYKAAIYPGTDVRKALEFFNANAEAWRGAMHERNGCVLIESELVVVTDGEDTGRMGTYFTTGAKASKDKACLDLCQSLRRPRTTVHVVGLGTLRTLDLPVLRGLSGISLAKGTFHVVRPHELALVPGRIVDHLLQRGPLAEIMIKELLGGSGRGLEEREDAKLFAWTSFEQVTDVPFYASAGHTICIDIRFNAVNTDFTPHSVRLWRALSYSLRAVEIVTAPGEGSGRIDDAVAMHFQSKYIESVYLHGKMDEFLTVVRTGDRINPDDGTHPFLKRLRGLLGTVADHCTRLYGASVACKKALDAFVDSEVVKLAEDWYRRHGTDGFYYSQAAWAAIEADFIEVAYFSQGTLGLLEDPEETQSQLEQIHSSQRGLVSGMVRELEEEDKRQRRALCEMVLEMERESSVVNSPQYLVEQNSMGLYCEEEMEPPTVFAAAAEVVRRTGSESIPEEGEEEKEEGKGGEEEEEQEVPLTKDADADFSAGGAAAPRSQATDPMTGETEVGDRAV